MYLFILESIGTSELILIGIVALIFLGPRKLPDIARKIGKITSEFRNTTNEFKQTWEREVNFEEEASLLRDDDPPPKIGRESLTVPASPSPAASPPEVKSIDPAIFADAVPPADADTPQDRDPADPDDKRNWF